MPTPDRFPRNQQPQAEGNRQARLHGIYHGVFTETIAETISDSPVPTGAPSGGFGIKTFCSAEQHADEFSFAILAHSA
jgi:hypothetical protein